MHLLMIQHSPFTKYFNVILLQEQTEVQARVPMSQIILPQPVILIRGSVQEPKEAYLATDKVILCKLSMENALLALMAAFYSFNVQYTPGCTNFFSFIDTYFLDHKMPKRSRISNFLAQLNSFVV